MSGPIWSTGTAEVYRGQGGGSFSIYIECHGCWVDFSRDEAMALAFSLTKALVE